MRIADNDMRIARNRRRIRGTHKLPGNPGQAEAWASMVNPMVSISRKAFPIVPIGA